MATWQLGDRAVLRGRAIGTITALGAGLVTVTPLDARDDEGGFELSFADAAEALRPVVTVDEARAAIEALGQRGAEDNREIADRSIAYRRALKSGELSAQLRELGSIYHRAAHDSPERQYLAALENVVYAELALVLGKQRRGLKAEVRRARLGEPLPASLSLPDRGAELAAQALPELAGYRAIGAFAIDTKLAVGELDAALTLTARPGIWLAYASGDVDDSAHHVIAMHRDMVAELDRLARQVVARGEVTAEAASVSLCELALLEDREFVDEVSSEGAGIHRQRCLVWSVGGDGSFPVSTASRDDCVVYVRVDFT